MKRFEPKSYLLTVAASWLLMSLALFAGTFAMVETFSLTVDPAFLLGLCLLSALGSALVYAAPRAALRVGLVCMLCGLLALYVWWKWEDFANGAQVLFYQVSYGFHQEIPSVLYYELPRAFSRSYQRQCAAVFLAVCVPLLALWLGPWLTLTWPVWPAVGAVAGLFAVPLLLLRQPQPLTLAAFLLFLSLVILARRGYRENAATGARRVFTALVPAALTMALLGAVIPANANPRPVWLEDLRLTLQRLPTNGFVVGVGGVGNTTPGEQAFGKVGPLNFDGHTVLQINSTSAQKPLFLRGFSAGQYTAEGWMPLDDTSDPYPLNGQTDSRHPFNFPYQSQSYVTVSSVRITDMASHTDYYYLPYYPSKLPQDGVFVQDSYLERPSGTDEYRISFVPQSQMNTAATIADALGGDAAYYAEYQYRQWVRRNYLDVPYDLLGGEALQMLQDFADEHSLQQITIPDGLSAIAGASSSAELHTAVHHQLLSLTDDLADYLASFTEYDQSTPVTPAGEDFVSYFLTASHRGYCVHYASSAVLFFRACGVPARYAAGYVARPGRANSVTNIPDRNAHAWVELYLDGFGWMPVDVTPGFSGGGNLSDPTAADPTPTPTPTATPAAPSSTPTPTPATPSPTPSATPTAPSVHPAVTLLLPLLFTLLGLLALAGLIYLQYFLRLAHLRKKCTVSDPNAATISLYLYLKKLTRRAKVKLPQEAFDLAQKACFSQHIITNDELSAIRAMAQAAAENAKEKGFFSRLILKYFWALL